MAAAAPAESALGQTLDLLTARDDTSKFVGLSLLRSLLDSNEELRTNTQVLLKCWNAISNKFLIRLMKPESSKRSRDEAKSMIDLAVAVVHTFANLLPPSEVGKEKMTEFCEPLVRVTPRLDPAPQMLAFQASQCIASSSPGATALANVKDWKDFGIGTVDNEWYLREFFRLYSVANKYGNLRDSQRGILEGVMLTTLNRVEKQDPTMVLEAFAELTTELSFVETPSWTSYLISLIQKAITTRPAAKTRAAAFKLVGNLIQSLPPNSDFANKFFVESSSGSSDPSKPFSYIFVNLALIDIRSTIPSLMESLASPSYTSTALRLAACFDILSAFIMYLLQSFDPDTDITEDAPPSVLPPDLLLKLRRDFSETFSLTLEFFRDRWDATVSGAGGLDPSARTDPNAPLALTWDNPSISPAGDPIFLAGLRALSLWLREDENPELQKQAVSIMDILMSLYSASTSSDAKVDFRHPVLTSLAGLLPDSDDAAQNFLDQNGWTILANNLTQCFLPLNTGEEELIPAHTQDIIRVLLIVAESATVPQSREAWMNIVKLVVAVNMPSVRNKEAIETLVGGWQLAVAIVLKAPKKLRGTVKEEMKKITTRAQVILTEGKGKLETALEESLMEVVDGLDGIA